MREMFAPWYPQGEQSQPSVVCRCQTQARVVSSQQRAQPGCLATPPAQHVPEDGWRQRGISWREEPQGSKPVYEKSVTFDLEIKGNSESTTSLGERLHS